MVYLFVAYSVFWALTFVFVFSISSKQKSLEREIEALKKLLEHSRLEDK